jgi:hypothetical protein
MVLQDSKAANFVYVIMPRMVIKGYRGRVTAYGSRHQCRTSSGFRIFSQVAANPAGTTFNKYDIPVLRSVIKTFFPRLTVLAFWQSRLFFYYVPMNVLNDKARCL